MKLENKIVLVTGGAGLLGKVFCQRLSDEGANVIISDVDFDKAKELSSKIKNSFPLKININNKESIEEALALGIKKFGRIDALVNNAYPRNKNYGKKFFDVTYDDFCENLNLNIGGYFLTSQVFLKYFTQNKSGNVVSISSIYGVVAPKFEVYDNTPMTMPVEYAAIKSSLLHLTKYMAKFVKGNNIRVNCISPGGILDKQPSDFLESYKSNCLNKGMLNPEDIAGALVFLLSDDSKFVNGQNLIVDDGFTL